MLDPIVLSTGSSDRSSLVFLHFLGGSSREWEEVAALLCDEYRIVAIDLPGFGAAADQPGYSVQEMADAVEHILARLNLGRYTLVGHSMGGKVSAVLSRRFASLANAPEGLILVAPSPPGPEPMTEKKRSDMLAELGDVRDGDRQRATTYISRNEERDIPATVLARTVEDVLCMNRSAWVAWLEHGSKEDWADRVGVLDLPTLIVAGEKDGSLGPEVQRRVTLPHFGNAEVKSVLNCSHLIPLERPRELAVMIREFLASHVVESQTSSPQIGKPQVNADYLSFMASDRLSPRTREVLEARLAGPEPASILTSRQLQTLRALLARIIPQPPDSGIDLAGYVAAQLAAGKGDGWRYAVLPTDAKAYRQFLDELDEAGFNKQSDSKKDETIQDLAERNGSPQARWFEEVRGDATAAYIAHPATLARIGYSGVGVGGAHTPHQGFAAIGIGEVEEWEPKSSNR